MVSSVIRFQKEGEICSMVALARDRLSGTLFAKCNGFVCFFCTGITQLRHRLCELVLRFSEAILFTQKPSVVVLNGCKFSGTHRRHRSQLQRLLKTLLCQHRRIGALVNQPQQAIRIRKVRVNLQSSAHFLLCNSILILFVIRTRQTQAAYGALTGAIRFGLSECVEFWCGSGMVTDTVVTSRFCKDKG